MGAHAPGRSAFHVQAEIIWSVAKGGLRGVILMLDKNKEIADAEKTGESKRITEGGLRQIATAAQAGLGAILSATFAGAGLDAHMVFALEHAWASQSKAEGSNPDGDAWMADGYGSAVTRSPAQGGEEVKNAAAICPWFAATYIQQVAESYEYSRVKKLCHIANEANQLVRHSVNFPQNVDFYEYAKADCVACAAGKHVTPERMKGNLPLAIRNWSPKLDGGDAGAHGAEVDALPENIRERCR